MGLDVGSGNRNWKEFCKCDCIGIDLPLTLKNPKENLPDVCGSAVSLPFRDNSFDFLSCYSVLSYVEDLDGSLQEIHRVLKSNGFAVIIVVNPRGMALHKEVYWKNRLNSEKLHKKLFLNGFKSIKHRNPKALLYSIYYNLTSVYAYAIVQPIKEDGEK